MLLALLAADMDSPRDADWLETQQPAARRSQPEAPAVHTKARRDIGPTAMRIVRLRKVLGDEAIVNHGKQAYGLACELVTTDIRRFNDACSVTASTLQSEPERSAQVSRDALRCWRGRPFSGIGDTPFLDATAAELQRRRGLMATRLADLHLLGFVDQPLAPLVDDLERVLRDDPYDAAVVYRLAVVLDRLGHDAKAIAVLDSHASECGESAEALGIRRAILECDVPRRWSWQADLLRQMDRPASRSGGRRLPPRPELPLRERHAALALLDEALRRAANHGPIVALVLGEPGVGKTSLALDWAHDLPGSVHVGFCRFDPGLETGPAVLRKLINAPRRLASSDSDLAEVAAQLVDDVLAVASGGPTVLILDDLHEADSLTHLVMTRLAADAPPTPLVLVATSRVSGHADVELRGLRDRARRTNRLVEAVLSPLSEAAVCDVLNDAGCELAETWAPTVLHHSAGNPYVTVQFARELARHGSIQAGLLGTIEAAGDLSAKRLDALSAEALVLLEMCSGLGSTADLEILERVRDCSASELDHALEPLRGSGLLRDEPDHTSVRFEHDLLRMYVLERMPEARRRDVHRHLATAMSSLPEWCEHRPGVVATQWEGSPTPERSLPHLLLAATIAQREYLFSEVLDLLQRAERWIASDDDHALAQLWLQRSHALHAIGRLTDSTAAARTANAFARLAGDQRMITDAAIGASGRYVSVRHDASQVDALRATIELVENPALMSRLYARLATVDRGHHPDHGEWIDRCIELAEHSGDLGAQCGAVHLWFQFERSGPDPKPRLQRLRDTFAITDGLADTDTVLTIAVDLAHAAAETGCTEQGFAALDELERRLGDALRGIDRWWIASHRALLHAADGDVDAALVLARDGRDRGRNLGIEDAGAWYVMQRWALNRLNGQAGALVDTFRRAANDVHPSWRAAFAAELAAIGDSDAARVLLDRLADESASWSRNYLWAGTMAICGFAAAQVDHPLADVARVCLMDRDGFGMIYGSGCAYLGRISSGKLSPQ